MRLGLAASEAQALTRFRRLLAIAKKELHAHPTDWAAPYFRNSPDRAARVSRLFDALR